MKDFSTTALIAVTLLVGMLLVFGFGYQMVAHESADLIRNYEGEFNLPNGTEEPLLAEPNR